MLKAALYGQEASEHKGGKLAIAWKHRGDVRDCHTHRSLLVSSHLGKTIHRALRQKYNCLYNAYMQRQQLGGRPYMPVGVPLHITRAFMRWNRSRNQPVALVFLDLTEAFYRTLRPLAVGGNMSEQCIGLMCQRLGLDTDALHELHELLQQQPAVANAQAPAHVQRLLQALHRDTWFQIGQQKDLIRTEIGSRPGDSFADVVFGYLWAKILGQLETQLVQHGILEFIPDIQLPNPFAHQVNEQGPGIPLLGPTWMDDLNVLITASTNFALVQKTQLATSLLLDVCAQHHMTPNLQKGKTEVMFRFCGAHSREFRRKFYSETPCLPVVCERTTARISVVSRYVHLGGVVHHRDVNKPEIRRRLAIAHQALQQHRRILYRNSHIAWQTRCDMFQTLVLSKMMYGLESWTFATQDSRTQIHNGIMKLYRKFLGCSHCAHLTDMEVLVRTGLPDPTELLRRARLRYFGTLHNCKENAHWGVLQEDQEWLALLKDDLHWMWMQLTASVSLADPKEHFPAWQDLILYHGGYWKKLIRKAVTHACLQRKNEYHATELHRSIGQLLLEEEVVTALPSHTTKASSLEAAVEDGCMQCHRKFASYAGEAVHMCRTHKTIAHERFLFDSTQCPGCLKEFHTHSGVLAHLRVAIRCKEVLQGRRFACAPAPGVGSITDRALHDKIDGTVPCIQAQGPLLPDLHRRQRDEYNINFLEELYMFLLDLQGDAPLLPAVRNLILNYPISWTQCHRTLKHMLAQFSPEDHVLFAFPFHDIEACIEHCADSRSWSFLHDQQQAPTNHSPANICEWEAWYVDLANNLPSDWNELKPLPLSLTRYKILLHAFAGRRRQGDIEWFLTEAAKNLDGFVLMTVSIDIVIDSKFGDISNAETRAFWLSHIRAGFIAGFIAGPPCNTWSRARAIQLPDAHGPRVVRTPSAPWGLESLRIGELHQVTIGTILLGFAFECMVAMALHCGSGLLEHPRDSGDPDAVSIWRLPILQVLLNLPGMRLIHVAQGLYGAPSPKPTSLLVLTLPTLEKELHAGRLTCNLPTSVSIGRDAEGHFHTAPLKEYPPGFCRSIAKAFHHDFCTPTSLSTEYEDVPSALLSQCQAMHGRAVGNFIGPD